MRKNLPKLIIEEIIRREVSTPKDLASLKREVAKKLGVKMSTNVELLREYHKLVKIGRIKENKKLEDLLRIRKIRSLSGVVVVSVLTKAYPCGGNCLFCPTQKGIPKSYLDSEPAVMRAIFNKFDPYLQVKNRIKALRLTGHPTDKIDLRIIGGTWSYNPKLYQTWFIKRCFQACNKRTSKNLELAQKINEKAKHRIIGINIETRPDYITESEIKRLRKLGVTRVELGVQSIYDDVLELNRRGHKVEATIYATKLLKDAGFKICYQMMPNLPGSDLIRDEKMFEELFLNSNFQPDHLKIYPCALLKEAPLYWVREKIGYQPYSGKDLIDLIKKIKKKIPNFCRIQRIVRDIPSEKIIEGGAKISNLRQLIAEDMKKEDWQCHCIRCREVKENYNPKEKIYLYRQDYEASGGKEIFLSFENKNREKLYSLLRLRVPSQIFGNKRHFLPILEKTALIREMQTFGQLVPIGKKQVAPQHRGLGKKLINEAEKIAKKEFGLDTIAAISGIGAREYFKEIGYELKDTYMIKGL